MTTTHYLSELTLPWESLEAIISGISAIDLTGMPIRDREEAYQFILHYGYDMNRPEDAAEIKAFFIEAVNFINERFLANSDRWVEQGEVRSPAAAIPASVTGTGDVLGLLLMASQGKSPDKYWACAILKVMHTLSHIQNGPYYRQFGEAREQILQRFSEALKEVPGEGLSSQSRFILNGLSGQALELYGFEAKSLKSRESILVKMLCKKENVAENINDLIGVRFITQTPAEAVLVVQILRERKVILFPNIIPSRSRNNLIDLEKFERAYDAVVEGIEQGTKDFNDLGAFFREFSSIPDDTKSFNEHNPASSPDYRSIHITCRQLIRLPNPDTLEEIRFFIPYEIQIMDKQSYFDSRNGSSAHQLYKQNQFVNARRRVLGQLLALNGKK